MRSMSSFSASTSSPAGSVRGSISGRRPAARLGHACGRRAVMQVYAVNYDPENLYKSTPDTGIIEKRLRQKLVEKNKDVAIAISKAQTDIERENLFRRESRTPPEDSIELIEYLLNTPQDDIEFEVSRNRPKFSPAFFKVLDTLIGQERFAEKADEDRMAELELLRKYVEDTSKMVDVAVNKLSSAAERMKKLLTSKDKKQCILDMAAANEIDQALLMLLQQNSEAARDAGQEDAAKFMDKVKVAAGKYVISAPRPAAPPAPAGVPILAPTPAPPASQKNAQPKPALERKLII